MDIGVYVNLKKKKEKRRRKESTDNGTIFKKALFHT